MNKELLDLIDFAIADGTLSDKHKEVIYRKAQALGVDDDEVDLILHGKLHLKQQNQQTSTTEPDLVFVPFESDSPYVTVPSTGSSSEFFIGPWQKNIGDEIKVGDVLVEVESDKVSMEINATKNGKLMYQAEGKDGFVYADDLIAIIGDDVDDVNQLVDMFVKKLPEIITEVPDEHDVFEIGELKELPFHQMMQYKNLALHYDDYPEDYEIEHQRTDIGYKVKVFEDGRITDQIEFQTFFEFEYDQNYISKLSLPHYGINSFSELRNRFDVKALNKLTHLYLDDNHIKNWDGIEDFKSLRYLSLKNNEIQKFPTDWPPLMLPGCNPEITLEYLDLEGNDIDQIQDVIPAKDDETKIMLLNNPITNRMVTDEDLPQAVALMEFVYEEGRIDGEDGIILSDDLRFEYLVEINEEGELIIIPLLTN